MHAVFIQNKMQRNFKQVYSAELLDKCLNGVALDIGNPSQIYGTSPAIWDHTCYLPGERAPP